MYSSENEQLQDSGSLPFVARVRVHDSVAVAWLVINSRVYLRIFFETFKGSSFTRGNLIAMLLYDIS